MLEKCHLNYKMLRLKYFGSSVHWLRNTLKNGGKPKEEKMKTETISGVD